MAVLYVPRLRHETTIEPTQRLAPRHLQAHVAVQLLPVRLPQEGAQVQQLLGQRHAQGVAGAAGAVPGGGGT